jgi:lysophospholipase L1-like esterase
MSRFPVNTQRNIQEILLTEGIPSSWTMNTVLASVTNGQEVQNFYFDSGTGSYLTNPSFMPYITGVTLRASRDIIISFRVDNIINKKFKGPNDNVTPNGYSRINTQIYLKANELYKIDTNQLILFGWLSSFTILNIDPTTTAVTINTNILGYNITKNTNIFASKQLLWIGDSISYGTGATNFENVTTPTPVQSSTPNQEPFTQQVKKNLIYKGYDFWLTNKAQSSMTTDGVVQAIKWGYYDNTSPELICIMIGANDADNLGSGGLSNVTNQGIFLSNITFINNYFSKRFPSAKILWIGSTPSADTPTETNIAIGRGIIDTYISGLSLPNIKYTSLVNAFVRTTAANYLTADTIHPTAQNAIATAIQTFIDTTGWYE